MPFRRWGWVIVLVAALGAAFAAPAAAPSPSQERIIAVGDLHGDYRAWRVIAAAAGLIDRTGRWTGGRTILVQTGDVADRGPDSLKIIHDLRRLQSEARRAGGRVIALVGNHEAMNVIGDLRYVHPGEYAAFTGPRSRAIRDRYYAEHGRAIEEAARQQTPDVTPAQIRATWEQATPLGMIEHRRAWHPEADLGGWVVRNPAIVKLGGLLFVHGGLGPAYAGLPVEVINRRVAAALAARDEAESAIINDPDGPLWYRGLIVREEGDVNALAPPIEQQLSDLLGRQGVRAIVVGHTPSKTGIIIDHDERLVRIDTGISRHYGGPLSYLEIAGGRIIPRTVARADGPRAAR